MVIMTDFKYGIITPVNKMEEKKIENRWTTSPSEKELRIKEAYKLNIGRVMEWLLDIFHYDIANEIMSWIGFPTVYETQLNSFIDKHTFSPQAEWVLINNYKGVIMAGERFSLAGRGRSPWERERCIFTVIHKGKNGDRVADTWYFEYNINEENAATDIDSYSYLETQPLDHKWVSGESEIGNPSPRWRGMCSKDTLYEIIECDDYDYRMVYKHEESDGEEWPIDHEPEGSNYIAVFSEDGSCTNVPYYFS